MNVESRDAIRERAYVIWEVEGRPHGRELDHWLQAESELGRLGETPLRPKADRRPRAQNGATTAGRARPSRPRAKGK